MLFNLGHSLQVLLKVVVRKAHVIKNWHFCPPLGVFLLEWHNHGKVHMNAVNRPSIQDVARLAGVAVGTVSNCLNNPEKVKAETLSKVTRAIAQLGFVRNDAARQLKAGKSQTIGLVVLDSSNPFFAELARGAEDRAASIGMSLLVGNSGNDELRESRYINLFEQQRTAGVLVSPSGGGSGLVSALKSKGFRTVLVDRMADPDLCCSVGVDDIAGGGKAVQHLIDQGRTRIAFVGGPMEIKQVQDRLTGAREVIAANPKVSLRIIESAGMTVTAGREVGNLLACENEDLRPDALFAANDLIAIGVLQAFLYKAQVRVPEDMAVIGYDDIGFAETAIVALSSIRQPAREIGETAVELMLDEIVNGSNHKHSQITFQPELIVRASSAVI
jgi:LacI family transcriptional regulator